MLILRKKNCASSKIRLENTGRDLILTFKMKLLSKCKHKINVKTAGCEFDKTIRIKGDLARVSLISCNQVTFGHEATFGFVFRGICGSEPIRDAFSTCGS